MLGEFTIYYCDGGCDTVIGTSVKEGLKQKYDFPQATLDKIMDDIIDVEMKPVTVH
jgi:hypothetical protein